jgi:hypothetical protein
VGTVEIRSLPTVPMTEMVSLDSSWTPKPSLGRVARCKSMQRLVGPAGI